MIKTARILDFEQGSPEWHAHRRTSIGASNIAAIMGDCPFQTKLDVYNKMVNDTPFVQTERMKEGVRKEPLARSWCEKRLLDKFTNPTIQHPFFDWMHASFDAINEQGDCAVEIKCPGIKSHVKVRGENEIPYNYQWQMLCQMEVANLPGMWFCSYMDDEDALLIWMDRDDVRIEEMNLRVKEFYFNHIVPKIPPSQEKIELVNLEEIFSDEEKFFLDLQFSTIQKLEKNIKMDQELLTEIKNRVFDICRGLDSSYKGRKITKTVRKGNIDYSEIEALKSVNLELYRKPSTEYWRIT